MGIETCRDEEHFGGVGLQSRDPHFLHGLAQDRAVGAGAQRHVDHVGGRFLGAAVRVVGMLESAHHQHPLVAAEDILGAVPMVDVEVDHGHACEAMALQRTGRGDRHIVEEAESHGPRTHGVMPGRPYAAKRALDAAAGHEIGRKHRGSRRAQRGSPGMRTHGRIGIQVHRAMLRRRGAHFFDVVERMHASDVFDVRERRFVPLEHRCQARGDEMVLDGGEPLGAFRMMPAHLVFQAIAMGNEGCGHGPGPENNGTFAKRASCRKRDASNIARIH